MSENKYFSSKRFGPISTGHRQWKDNGHCAWAHGYGRIVEIIFWGSELDSRGWIVDFGDLRDVKKWLNDQWDHRILLAHDDPLIDQFKTLETLGGCNINIMPKEYGPGIELSCKFVYDMVDEIINEKTNGRCGVQQVRIWEHENNSAIYGAYPQV